MGTAGLLCLCSLWPLCLEVHLHINPQPSVTHTAGWPGSNATSSRETFWIPSSPPQSHFIWTSFGEFGLAAVCRPHQSASRLVFPEPPHQAGPREHLPRAIPGVPLPNFSLIRSVLCYKPAVDPIALGIKSIAFLMPPGLTPPCLSSLIPSVTLLPTRPQTHSPAPGERQACPASGPLHMLGHRLGAVPLYRPPTQSSGLSLFRLLREAFPGVPFLTHRSLRSHGLIVRDHVYLHVCFGDGIS